MKAYKYFILILWLFCSVSVSAQSSQTEIQPKTIILKIKKEYTDKGFERSIKDTALNTLFEKIRVTSVRKKFPRKKALANSKNAQGLPLVDLSRIYEVKYDSDILPEKVAAELKKLEIIEYAEPKFIPKPFYIPNDPSISTMYHLRKIKAIDAWDIEKGDTNVVIGITDTGCDMDHEDLEGNIKHNYLDIIDGIDNDFDGYTDNFSGWDVGDNDNYPQSTTNHHGVHVTGLADAVTDNAIGIAAAGFKCKFLPIKIADSSGVLSAAYEGVVYAADHGCQIINCSWGGGAKSDFGQDVINYATINQNALVIAAAGNNGNETVFYPAAYKYVLNVGGTDSTDNRFVVNANFASNYGIHLDVCAPGKGVLSTWIDNQYITSNGTSMSAPVAAGAAGIIKSHFPNYSGLQIGELLKVTSDNIDSINAGIAGKLGAGRINLYRALTENNSPSIVMTERIVTDSNDNVFLANDTLSIEGTFTNYLAPSSNVIATITSSNTFVAILNNTSSLGSFSTLESKTNDGQPFKVKILSGVPVNTSLVFKIEYVAGSYRGFEYFEITVNRDFINIGVNKVSTTITSKGRVGFNNPGQGFGFSYKNESLLYECGLMIGANVSQVSDVARGVSLNPDNDFVSVERVAEIPTVQPDDIYLKGVFNDNGAASSKLNLSVTHHTVAFDSTGHDKYIIQKFDIRNNSSDTLKNIYVGYYTDWDIMDATENEANGDTTIKLGYIFSQEVGGLFGGIKVLSEKKGNIYSINNTSGGAGGVDISNGFESLEKYITLSTKKLSAGQNGADVSQVVSTGTYLIAPGDTIFPAFAIIAGDNIDDIKVSANNSQVMFNSIFPVNVKEVSVSNNLILFPNPAKEGFYVRTTLNNDKKMELSLIDMLGKNVDATFVSSSANTFYFNTSQLKQGVYFLISQMEMKKSVHKIMVLN